MAPRWKQWSEEAAARARFKEKAAEAKRLRLYRYPLAGNERMTAQVAAELEETMWRYHQAGATNWELAAIFGYSSAKAIYAALRRIRQQRDVEKSSFSDSDAEAESEESASEDMAASTDESTFSHEEAARSPEDSTQRRFLTSFWAAYARRTQEQSANTPVDRCSSRHVRASHASLMLAIFPLGRDHAFDHDVVRCAVVVGESCATGE